MRRKIIVAGGSGFLGQSIVEHFSKDPQAEIVVLSRKNAAPSAGVRFVRWGGADNYWEKELDGSDLIINLSGRSVNCRYTPANKQIIINSRVDTTKAIDSAIRKTISPPSLWINMSSAAIYGNTENRITDETGPYGSGFPAEVCKLWEAAFFRRNLPKTRKVALRAGLVFQKGRGLLLPFVNLARFGFGGAIGRGDQYISWIHETDFLKIIETAVREKDFQGSYNCCSPLPVTNAGLMRALRRQLKIPFGLPSPSIAVKFGALFIGTEPELILTGRRVVSEKLDAAKFSFSYPEIDSALKNLL